MNYELAKQLTDAGFTRSIDRNIPTLSELLEACGDGRISISRLPPEFSLGQKKWFWYARGEDILFGIGDSPEEAVAKLWLELNKKL